MIDEAERKGLLKPGGTIVEGTSGNTGMGLALIAAVRGYKIVFTITDKQSREKIELLKAFGAEVIVCPTAVEPEDPRSYYSVAKKLSREIPNAYYPNQYEKRDESRGPLSHHRPGNLERYRRKNHALRLRPGNRRHDHRRGAFPQGKESESKSRSAWIRIGSLYYEYWKTGNIGKAQHVRGRRNRRGYSAGHDGFLGTGRRDSGERRGMLSYGRDASRNARAFSPAAPAAAAFRRPCALPKTAVKAISSSRFCRTPAAAI